LFCLWRRESRREKDAFGILERENMMIVDIESVVLPEPMASMLVQVVATNFSTSKSGSPYLTSESATYSSFCVQVDALISSLEKLKSKAKLKFDEFDRN